MRRTLALLVGFLFACTRSSPPAPPAAHDAGGAASSATASATASAAPPPVDTNAPYRELVQKWNEAHHAHDAAALEKLYAPKITFYGVTMSAADAAKKKAAAFKASPDFTQAAGLPELETSADKSETWARFMKTTSSAGKSGDYPVLLIFDADKKIKEEADDVTHDEQWCAKTPMPRVSGLTMTVADVMTAAQKSKHMSAWKQGAEFARCAKRCAAPSRDCDYEIHLIDFGSGSGVTVGSVYLEASTKTLWWHSVTGAWESEKL